MTIHFVSGAAGQFVAKFGTMIGQVEDDSGVYITYWIFSFLGEIWYVN